MASRSKSPPSRSPDNDSSTKTDEEEQKTSIISYISSITPSFLSKRALTSWLNVAFKIMRGKKGAIYDQEKRDKLNIALQRLQQKVYIQDNSIWNIGSERSCIVKKTILEKTFFYEFVTLLKFSSESIVLLVNELASSPDFLDKLNKLQLFVELNKEDDEEDIDKIVSDVEKNEQQQQQSSPPSSRGRVMTIDSRKDDNDDEEEDDIESVLRDPQKLNIEANFVGNNLLENDVKNIILQQKIEKKLIGEDTSLDQAHETIRNELLESDFKHLEPRVMKIVVNRPIYEHEIAIYERIKNAAEQKLTSESPNIVKLYNSFVCDNVPAIVNSEQWKVVGSQLSSLLYRQKFLQGNNKSNNNNKKAENPKVFIGHMVFEYAAHGDSYKFFQTLFPLLSTKLSKLYSLALQLSHAVFWLHRNLIIHRDLHAKNILIDSLAEIDYETYTPVTYVVDKSVGFRFHDIQELDITEKTRYQIKTPLNIVIADFETAVNLKFLGEQHTTDYSTSRIDVRAPELILPFFAVDLSKRFQKRQEEQKKQSETERQLQKLTVLAIHDASIDVWALVSILSRWFSNDTLNGGIMDQEIYFVDIQKYINPYMSDDLKMVQQVDMTEAYKKSNFSVKNLIEALRFTEMFIIWSKQSQLAEILQPFTESYNVHTNSAVALQLLNMIKKLGIEGMFEWLNESELVAKKTSKVNLVENFRIFIKDTEKKIDMWLEKYNVFNKKPHQTYTFPQKSNLTEKYKFNSQLSEIEKSRFIEIFENVFLWDYKKRKTSEWVFRKLLSAFTSNNSLSKYITTTIPTPSPSNTVIESEISYENVKNKKQRRDSIMTSEQINCNYCYTKTENTRYQCSSCKSRKYCSTGCGEMDWYYALHNLSTIGVLDKIYIIF